MRERVAGVPGAYQIGKRRKETGNACKDRVETLGAYGVRCHCDRGDRCACRRQRRHNARLLSLR